MNTSSLGLGIITLLSLILTIFLSFVLITGFFEAELSNIRFSKQTLDELLEFDIFSNNIGGLLVELSELKYQFENDDLQI